LFWGALFSLALHAVMIGCLVCYALAVGLSIFTMVVTDTEHPPASGTALGVAITGMSPDVVVAVVLGIVLLSLIHRFFKPYLRDLT
jgi:CBS-domain-containing membrane protein